MQKIFILAFLIGIFASALGIVTITTPDTISFVECKNYLNSNLNVTIISIAENSITFKLAGPKVHLDDFNCLAETITVVNANVLHYGFWNSQDCYHAFSSVALSYWSHSGGNRAQHIERTSNSCYLADENGQYFFSYANNYVRILL